MYCKVFSLYRNLSYHHIRLPASLSWLDFNPLMPNSYLVLSREKASEIRVSTNKRGWRSVILIHLAFIQGNRYSSPVPNCTECQRRGVHKQTDPTTRNSAKHKTTSVVNQLILQGPTKALAHGWGYEMKSYTCHSGKISRRYLSNTDVIFTVVLLACCLDHVLNLKSLSSFYNENRINCRIYIEVLKIL